MNPERSMNVDNPFDALMNTNIDELDYEGAVEFCKLIEDGDKALINQFSFMVSNTGNINIAKAMVKYVSSDKIGIRNLSGEILINLGELAVEPLLESLIKGDKHEKKFIIDVLGLIADKRASDKILEVMEAETDENVILACIEALGNIKEERAVNRLINLYNSNELFIPSIIEALGKIGSDASVGFITSVYSDDDPLIKFSIVESLGNIGTPQSFYFLLSELKKLEGPIAWAAVESIHKLSLKFNLEFPFEESFKNIVLNTLYEADPQYKKAALSLVINFDDPDIFDAYLSVLGYDYEMDEIVKEKLLNNVSATIKGIEKRIQEKSENISSLLYLLEEMCDSEEIEFKNYLSGLETQSFIDSLAGTLESPSEEARKSAINLMFKIDTESALLFVDKMLEDDNLWNKLFVLDMLENMPLSANVIGILENYMENADEMLKERISYIIETNKNLLSAQ